MKDIKREGLNIRLNEGIRKIQYVITLSHFHVTFLSLNPVAPIPPKPCHHTSFPFV